MKPINLLAVITFVTCGAANAGAQTVPSQLTSSPNRVARSASDQVAVPRCAVHLIDDIDVPAREPGLLVEVKVQEGQAIAMGDLLAQIDDQLSQRQLEEAQYKYQIASEKANDTTDVDAATVKKELLTRIVERSESLLKSGSVSPLDVEKERYQKEVAIYEFAKAQRDKRFAAVEAESEMVKVKAAQDSILRHKLISPIEGHVFQVFKHSGEWVAAGDTVLRIARMNKLKVTGFVDANEYAIPEILNRQVVITVPLPHAKTVELPGRIVNVDLDRKENGDSLQVWAEVDNKAENDQWVLHPDAIVDMKILLK